MTIRLAAHPEPRCSTDTTTVDIADGLVQTVRSIINPDKLHHLGPLADVRALLHERSERRQ